MNRAATVVADDQVLRIVGIDPEIVVIAVRAAADVASVLPPSVERNALVFSM